MKLNVNKAKYSCLLKKGRTLLFLLLPVSFSCLETHADIESNVVITEYGNEEATPFFTIDSGAPACPDGHIYMNPGSFATNPLFSRIVDAKITQKVISEIQYDYDISTNRCWLSFINE